MWAETHFVSKLASRNHPALSNPLIEQDCLNGGVALTSEPLVWIYASGIVVLYGLQISCLVFEGRVKQSPRPSFWGESWRHRRGAEELVRAR